MAKTPQLRLLSHPSIETDEHVEPTRITARDALTLEAFADTVVPGRKRTPDDVAIAGVADGPGAVECGALKVLLDPASGVADDLADVVATLDEQARAWSSGSTSTFADLDYRDRRSLVLELTNDPPEESDVWFWLTLLCTAAHDGSTLAHHSCHSAPPQAPRTDPTEHCRKHLRTHLRTLGDGNQIIPTHP